MDILIPSENADVDISYSRPSAFGSHESAE